MLNWRLLQAQQPHFGLLIDPYSNKNCSLNKIIYNNFTTVLLKCNTVLNNLVFPRNIFILNYEINVNFYIYMTLAQYYALA